MVSTNKELLDKALSGEELSLYEKSCLIRFELAVAFMKSELYKKGGIEIVW